MELARIICEVVLFLTTCVSIFLKVRDNKKLGKTDDCNSLTDTIFEAIKQVEEKYNSLELKGVNCASMKKGDVINIAKTTALVNGWAFDEEKVSAIIEKFIDFSHKVNALVKRGEDE